MLKVKNDQSGILYSAKISFRDEGKIKKFSDEGKIKAFLTRRYFKRLSKGSFRQKGNDVRRKFGTSGVENQH